MGILDKFIELQKNDREIYQLRQDQVRLPRFLEEKAQEVTEAKNALSRHEKNIKDLRLRQREQESQLNTIQTSIQKKTTQRNSVKTNKEYSTLTNEIEELEKKIGEIEDYIIGVMETIEREAQRDKSLKKDIENAEKEFSEQKKQTDSDLRQLEIELKQLEKKRRAQREEIAREEADVLQRYERVLKSNKYKSAMAAVEDDACSACYLQLLQNDKASVMAKKILFCKGCGRLLYLL